MTLRLRIPRLPHRLPEGVRAGQGVVPPSDRVAYVRRMFSAIAPRYDRTNSVISAGLHRVWKRQTVAALRLRPGERVLDLCCGTGDLARMMAQRVGPSGFVVGVDFAGPMIKEARRQAAGTRGGPSSARSIFMTGDAVSLPLADGSFDAAAMGFGLRNVADPAAALREVRRVLRPSGRLAILEFGRVPNPMLRVLYDVYSFTFMALLGRLVSGHPDAYWYLPVSIRHWLDQAAMLRLLSEIGFVNASYRNLAQGIVAVYRAEAGGAVA